MNVTVRVMDGAIKWCENMVHNKIIIEKRQPNDIASKSATRSLARAQMPSSCSISLIIWIELLILINSLHRVEKNSSQTVPNNNNNEKLDGRSFNFEHMPFK